MQSKHYYRGRPTFDPYFKIIKKFPTPIIMGTIMTEPYNNEFHDAGVVDLLYGNHDARVVDRCPQCQQIQFIWPQARQLLTVRSRCQHSGTQFGAALRMISGSGDEKKSDEVQLFRRLQPRKSHHSGPKGASHVRRRLIRIYFLFYFSRVN